MAELSEQPPSRESSFKLVIPLQYINLCRQGTLPSVCCWLFLQLWGPEGKGQKITAAKQQARIYSTVSMLKSNFISARQTKHITT